MNATQLRSNIAMVLHWVGLALAVVVLAKLAGANINFVPGSIDALAMVAIACSVAR